MALEYTDALILRVLFCQAIGEAASGRENAVEESSA